MSSLFSDLGKKKWFVPLLLFLILLIALSSFGKNGDTTDAELSTEERLAELCNSVKGVSGAKVMITYEAVAASAFFGGSNEKQSILGVAVVCDGGDDPAVQLALHKLIKSLFSLPSTKISVSGRG